MLDALRRFTRRQWTIVVLGTIGTALAVGLPTDVIPNPVFGRPVPVTWWSYPALAVTAVLGGLLLATYVRTDTQPVPADPDLPADGLAPQVSSTTMDVVPVGDGNTLVEAPAEVETAQVDLDRPARLGGVGGLLSFFAIGCPVCNKLVVIALGTVGARQWFEPLQPVLAVASIVLMAVALRARLRSIDSCPLPARP